MVITRQWLFAYSCSPVAGIWTRKQIQALGLEYPPRAGWVKRLIGRSISDERAQNFMRLREKSKAVRKAKQASLFPLPLLPEQQDHMNEIVNGING